MIRSGKSRKRLTIQTHAAPRRRGRPSQGETLELTRHIVAVAQSRFLEVGYDATAIDDVIERASISNQTFYKRFDNKASLLEEVVRSFTEDFLNERRRLDSDLLAMPLRDALIECACRFLKQTLRTDMLAFERLYLSVVKEFPNVSQILGAMIDAVYDSVADLLLAARDRGDLPVEDVRRAARWFADGAIAPRLRQASFGLAGLELTDVDRKEIEAYVSFYLNSFR